MGIKKEKNRRALGIWYTVQLKKCNCGLGNVNFREYIGDNNSETCRKLKSDL